MPPVYIFECPVCKKREKKEMTEDQLAKQTPSCTGSSGSTHADTKMAKVAWSQSLIDLD